jgi:hypothetical protein
LKRITIYGWVQFDPLPVKGAYALVDLVYFVSDNVTFNDIFSIIDRAGFRIISKKIQGTNEREKDRITIEDWDAHIKVGGETLPENQPEEGQYNRYNPPGYGSSM